MAVSLSPFAGAGWQFFDNNGVPLSGGLIYTYQSGSTTPLATYTTNIGNVANSNPIVLDTSGRVPNEVWLTVGFGYKFVIQTSTGTQIQSLDNIPSSQVPPIINDASSVSYEEGYTITAGSFIVGQTYQILTVGTTNFTTIGATSNTIGVVFTATGVGSGTGTAYLTRTVQNKLQEMVSIKDFGAVGDGSTDDTAAIQAAINASSGSSLYIPPASSYYKITSALNGISNIVIIGSGAIGTIRNTTTGTSSDINVFQFTNCSNFEIRNLGLYGANKAITSPAQDGSQGAGIALLNCSNFVLSENNIQYMTSCGIFVGAGVGVTSTSGQIVNNYLNNNGIASTAGSNYLTSASIDILLQPQNSGIVTKMLVEGNMCLSPNIVGIGASYYPDYTGSVYDITVLGNEIANKAKHGIMFYSGVTDSEAAFSCIASNNSIRNCGWIGIYLLGATQDMVVIGNKITNVCTNVPDINLMYAGIGGYSSQSAYGDSLGRGAGTVIANNSIFGFNGWSGIRLTGYNHVVIEGNNIKGDGTAANSSINSAYTYANNPISLQACTLTKVTNNSIRCTSPSECGSGAIYAGWVSGTTYNYFGNVLANNTIFNASNGIYSEYQTALNCSNNNIYLATSSSVIISNATNSNVNENVITRNATAAVADIRLTSSSSDISVINNKLIGSHTTGYGVSVESGCTYNIVASNDFSQLTALSNSSKLNDSGTSTQKFNNKFGNDVLADNITMSASATTTINNSNASSPGKIILWPINASAATLVQGPHSPYVSSIVSGVSFTISTADGGSAAGTELFGYQMIL